MWIGKRDIYCPCTSKVAGRTEKQRVVIRREAPPCGEVLDLIVEVEANEWEYCLIVVDKTWCENEPIASAKVQLDHEWTH